ncbi:MAG TPA: hypothetical protein PKD12_02260 [Nitrospira sp.]|nr:hypothetical protein [Nitrospira sp.]
MMKQAHRSMLQGFYRDQVCNSQNRMIWDSGWRANRIVESCNELLAALMKREPGVSGILYWAVGEGAAAWDSLMPSPSAGDRKLSAEVARKALSVENIAFLDENNQIVDEATPRLQISAAFTRGELGGEGPRFLREFGLFGGNATNAANTGWMIDYVIHPRIQLSEGMRLTRNLHLSFGVGGAGTVNVVGGFGGTLPVNSIDGVGQRFSSAFHVAGVRTLNDLIAVNPLQRIQSIPDIKFLEFRAKAKMVLEFRADLRPFASLSEWSISRLLQVDPESISAEVPDIATHQVIQIREALSVLQVALDDAALREVSLGTLLNS